MVSEAYQHPLSSLDELEEDMEDSDEEDEEMSDPNEPNDLMTSDQFLHGYRNENLAQKVPQAVLASH